MTARSLLAVFAVILFPACSTPPSSSSSTAEAGLLGDGASEGASDSGSSSDTSDSMTFSACLLAGTGVHSIVLVATSPTVCAQVAAYTVVDPTQPPASSRNPAVTTTPSTWAFRGAFAGASTGSCDVGHTYPPVTDISGTIAVDPTDASTISANVTIGYMDAEGAKTMTISATDVPVAPTCP